MQEESAQAPGSRDGVRQNNEGAGGDPPRRAGRSPRLGARPSAAPLAWRRLADRRRRQGHRRPT